MPRDNVALFIRNCPSRSEKPLRQPDIDQAADTRDLLALLEPRLHRIWSNDVRYMKRDIMLADLASVSMHY